MNFSFINFIILILIILVIIIVLVVIADYYCTIRGYVHSIIDKTRGLIPPMNLDDGNDIYYPEDCPEELSYEYFNKESAIFLGSVLRSTYNISKERDPNLPEYMKLIRKVGNNGYLYKINNENNYILSYRGTTSVDDLLTDIDSVQTSYINLKNKERSDIKIHRGFYSYWDESRNDLLEIIDDFTSYNAESSEEKSSSYYTTSRFNNIYSKNISNNKNNIKLIITGHSLGCSSASLAALSLSSHVRSLHTDKSIDISLYMFAPPRVGNDVFIEELNYYVHKNWAIINSSDIVPELPPVTLPTIGNNWIYDNWSNKIIIDVQYGSILLNHRVGTYICGFIDDEEERQENPSCSSYESELKWHRKFYPVVHNN